MTDIDPGELPPSTELQELFALAKRSLTGRPPKRNAASLEQVRAALERRALLRQRGAWAAGISCAALGACLLFLWFTPEAAPPLRFDVQRGALSSSGFVEGTEEGTRLRFSDGTQVALDARGRAHVDTVSPHGAELGLDRGSAKLDVVRRPGARWSVRAGPYLVRVTGTSFQVAFEPEQGMLKLDLLEGSVVVSGPSIDGSLQVSAGQHLSVRPGDALVLEQRRAPEAAQPVITEPAVAEPSHVEPPRGDSETTEAGASSNRARPAVVQRARAPRAEPESWRQKVAAARFDEVIALAEASSLEQVYHQASLEDLEALADAARYARRVGIARTALLALRERFANSPPAREAAFLLGRLDENAGYVVQARGWYERYLKEEPSGHYAPQAQGRLILLLREHDPAQARAAARQYLQRFPEGPYSGVARELAGEQ